MYNFDKTDIKIVNFLLEDGRMPASEIHAVSVIFLSVRFGIALNAWWMKVLFKSALLQNPQAFGLTTIADVWLEVESDRILEVAKKMADLTM